MQEILRVRATMTTGKSYLFNCDKANALYVSWQRDKEELADKEPCAILLKGFVVVHYDGKFDGSLQHVFSEHTEDSIVRDVVHELRTFYKFRERNIAVVGHLCGNVDYCVRRNPAQWTKSELLKLYEDRNTKDYDSFMHRLSMSYQNGLKGAQRIVDLGKNQFLMDVLPDILCQNR